MDAQTFLARLPDRDNWLMRAHHMLYAKQATVNGVAQVAIAFSDVPKVEICDFESEASCDLWWGEFVRLMTEECRPACIAMATVLIQPVRLARVVTHSSAQAHFIIFDFGNDRNIWCGTYDLKEQQKTFQILTQILGADFATSGGPPVIQ